MSDNAMPYPQYVTYTARFDDTFHLPAASAGDVYKVSVHASNVPPRVPLYQYGASAFVQLSSEVLSYDPGNNDANPGACYYHGCVFDGMIPANQITYLNFNGGLDAIVGPRIDGIAVGAGASASITLDLYKSRRSNA